MKKDYLDLDTVYTCRNKCIFCFIDQMPPSLRNTLYLKDDDFRFSYLYGNFITLTSLDDDALNYIAKMRMSPLYISVHTTNGELRKKMLKNRFADKILDQLKFFYDNEISMHLQIVLCPGYNDGKELEKTLEDLYELTPFAESVGIVPVGITKFRKDLPTLKLVDEKVAEKTFKIAKKFQKRAYDYYGVKWVYLADEFFIKIGKKIPSRSYYANFPQIENGIGISRLFIDSFKRAAKKKEFKNKAPYIVCGKIASYVIKPLLEETNAKAEFIVVENEFFGKTITVTGLLTAKDIFYNIRKFAKKNKPILIPDIIFNENEITLDGVKKEEFYKFDGRIKIIKTKGYALVREL